jgi:hypothetical protein
VGAVSRSPGHKCADSLHESSTLILSRFCPYTGRDPIETYEEISIKLLYSFFDWLLNQQRGKNGRKRRGTKYASSLGKYWKVFHLVYESATREKIDRGRVAKCTRCVTVARGLAVSAAALLTSQQVTRDEQPAGGESVHVRGQTWSRSCRPT